MAGEIVQMVDASKVRKGPEDALALAAKAKKLVAAKGKTITRFDLGPKGASQAELLAVMMGPTGNLRAPTLLLGTTLLVGFHEEMYREMLGE